MNKITLQCPYCNRTMQADRQVYDPLDADTFCSSCPECMDLRNGDVAMPIYFKNGIKMEYYLMQIFFHIDITP